MFTIVSSIGNRKSKEEEALAQLLVIIQLRSTGSIQGIKRPF
jgi:hypothetical protein